MNNVVALREDVLAPNLTDIKSMLHELFNPAWVAQHPDAWIEIAYSRPDGQLNEAQNWTVFELQDAAIFAEAKNKAGYNVYMGVALRHGKEPRSGRANRAHTLSSAFCWADFDGAGDAERIQEILKANNLVPAMVVTTGTTPHIRAHLYFRLDGIATLDQLEVANASLRTLLGSDDVQNADRILRLAGTVNYPSPDKQGRGYVDELTTLRTFKDAPAYKVERLIALAPASTSVTKANTGDPYLDYGNERARKDQHEIKELLDKVGGVDKWHKPMLKAVAKMIGFDWSDFQIKMVCAPYCDNGFNDEDLAVLIDKARKKWDKPDPGDTPAERKAPALPTVPIRATPYVFKDPATIPPRDRLYGDVLVRKMVSATISPGGVGKSSLVSGEALAMVSGKALLGVQPRKQFRVWLWNLEDPQEETERKIQAAAKYHRLTAEDIGDRLLVDSGRTQRLVIAKSTKDGAAIVQPVVDSLVAEILKYGIDVLVIDPFVSCHEVTENDNSAMDMVVKEWGKVAERGNCAVHLIHHTRKLGDAAEVTTESSRGGSSATDACRVVRTVNRMTKLEAEKAGVENPRRFFRTFDDKANLSPPAEKSSWFELVSVDLGNATDDMPSDNVGVVTDWEWPDATKGMTAADYDKVRAEVKGGVWREHHSSTKWVGYAIADALDLDLDRPTDKAKVTAALKMYLAAGTLVVIERKDENRKFKKFVEVPS